ncbi:MAG: hypothetical protein FD167_4523 [bacterium]|nr:MAG: hypothetical protein FD167_4523 [bacterium]
MTKFVQTSVSAINSRVSTPKKMDEFFDGLLKMKFGATWEQAFTIAKN